MKLAALLLAATPALVPQDRVPVVPEAPTIEPEPTFAVEVHYRTLATWKMSDDAPVAPGITLEIGVGHKGGRPRWMDEPVLARVTTDERGEAHAILQVPETWKGDEQAFVWARVETESYRRTVRSDSITAIREGQHLKLVVSTGATVLGRVCDELGEPVKGARVWLLATSSPSSTIDAAETDAAGWFAVDWRRTGEYVLHARASAHGSGTLDLELDLAEPPEALEVSLRGGRALVGRVLDPGGNPVGGLVITALPVGFDRMPDYGELVRRERSGGLSGAVTRTRRDGRFELPAMMDGMYLLLGRFASKVGYRIGADLEELGERLGTAQVGPESKPAELVLAQHRIEVTVIGDDGVPLDLEEPTRSQRSPRLELLQLEGGVVPAGEFPLRPICYEQRAVYRVEPNRDYLVVWQDAARPYVEIPVHVGWSRPLVPVEIRLPPPAEPAEVTVHVLAPDGTVFDAPRVRVRSISSGRDVADSVGLLGFGAYNSSREGTWRAELPAGRFVVEVSAEPIWGCLEPSPLPRAAHRQVEVEIEVLPSLDQTVEVRLLPAGHLDFERLPAHGPFTAPDESYFIESDSNQPELAQRRLGGGRVALVSESGSPLVGLRISVPGLYADELDWLVPGWPARCLTPLLPGRWTLLVEDERGVLFKQQLEIAEGRTTVVRW